MSPALQLTGTFVLPSDVLLIPVTELSESTRARLDCAEGDVAITRPSSRKPSSVVDANSARLLALFRSPARVVDAIIQFSREGESDPRVVLERAFPVIERLVVGGVLLPSGDERAEAITSGWAHGSRIGAFTIIDRVQVLEDVELHRARAESGEFVAIKIARRAHAERMKAALAREAAILTYLDGRGAPRLIAAETGADLPYTAQTWRHGVPPTRAAAEFRTRGNYDRRGLLEMCVSIAEAYASLHERGVLHGDVHDRNVLLGPDGEATLLDFGFAWACDLPGVGKTFRGGVPDYYDPQFAAAQRTASNVPDLDPAADQYCVAALLYYAVTGEPYLELSMRREDALRQIVEDPPLSFDARGAPAWPELESVLQRGLSKDPSARFTSMREFAGALRAIDPRAGVPAVASRTDARRRFISGLLDRLDPSGALYNDGLPIQPACSINNGAAGIAYAYYRMAIAREDAALLAKADAWISRAKTWSTQPEAWYTKDRVVARNEIGSIALYHTATGMHCVEALIAFASGEPSRGELSSNAFVDASRARCPTLDVTLGKAGLVAGAVLMLEAAPIRLAAVRRRAGALAEFLEKKLASFGPVDDEPRLRYLGIAHGWGGMLWTLLRWKRHARLAPSDALRGRLEELAQLATPRGRGLAWAWSADAREIGIEANPAPSWCNGATGHVHLWLEANAAYGDDRYLDLARMAGWNVWDDSRDGITDACCGLTGRAYAMLALHRRTGDDIWHRRAEALANTAMEASLIDSPTAHRLYKGELGVALLLEELESAPDGARMPLFESEGWKWA